MGANIRVMTKEDKQAVMEMMETFYRSPAVSTNGSREIFEKDIANCVGDSPYLEGFIFENGEEILGYGMIAKSFSTEFGKPCIWIEDIYVKDEYRGQGIASLFFHFVEEKYPHCILRLEVEAENKRAIHVYQKNGYDVLPYLEMKKEV